MRALDIVWTAHRLGAGGLTDACLSANPTAQAVKSYRVCVQGSVVKVTAIDPKTGVEASIVGPASAPRAVLQANAAAETLYVLKKQRGEA